MEVKKRNALLIGALVGAVLGAGTAHLLQAARENAEEAGRPVRADDLLKLTSSASSFIRAIFDLRQRL